MKKLTSYLSLLFLFNIALKGMDLEIMEPEEEKTILVKAFINDNFTENCTDFFDKDQKLNNGLYFLSIYKNSSFKTITHDNGERHLVTCIQVDPNIAIYKRKSNASQSETSITYNKLLIKSNIHEPLANNNSEYRNLLDQQEEFFVHQMIQIKRNYNYIFNQEFAKLE